MSGIFWSRIKKLVIVTVLISYLAWDFFDLRLYVLFPMQKKLLIAFLYKTVVC
jgi:hypothetical protein